MRQLEPVNRDFSCRQPRRQGVTELATANVQDFQDFGFARVWKPVG